MKHVTVLCGGRGSISLLKTLCRAPDVSTLSVIVNGFDDGMSTGLIRRAFPQLLGPSDFRKVSTALGAPQIGAYLEDRLDMDDLDGFAEAFSKSFAHLHLPVKLVVEGVLAQMRLEGIRDRMSRGNIVFAAMVLQSGSWQAAVDQFAAFAGVPEKVRLLSVCETPATLSAMTRDGVGCLTSEDAITYSRYAIGSIAVTPYVESTVAARAAFFDSDLVILGPGTFHSSLLPTTLLFREAVRARRVSCPVVWIVNFLNEAGTQGLTWLDLLDQLGHLPTHVVLDPQSELHGPNDPITPIRANTHLIDILTESVTSADAKHDGDKVLDLLRRERLL